MLLSLKFHANTYSFERVVTLFVGTTFHPDTVYIANIMQFHINIYAVQVFNGGWPVGNVLSVHRSSIDLGTIFSI